MKKILIILVFIALMVSCVSVPWEDKTAYEKRYTITAATVTTAFSGLAVVWAVNMVKGFFVTPFTPEILEKVK